MEVAAVTVVLLYFAVSAALRVYLGLSYAVRKPPPPKTRVSYPTKSGEKPEELEKVLEAIQTYTEGPPLTGEQVNTPIW